MKEHIDNLREYIENDAIYQDYKAGKIKDTDLSDFDMFCIEHCMDIEVVLENFAREKHNFNVEFYYNTDDFVKNDGVDLNSTSIQNLIDEVLSQLYKNSMARTDFSFCATGNTIVFGIRWEDEMNIFVCKNYEHGEAWKNNGKWEKIDWYNYKRMCRYIRPRAKYDPKREV